MERPKASLLNGGAIGHGIGKRHTDFNHIGNGRNLAQQIMKLIRLGKAAGEKRNNRRTSGGLGVTNGYRYLFTWQHKFLRVITTSLRSSAY